MCASQATDFVDENNCTGSAFLLDLLLCQFERVPDELWRREAMGRGLRSWLQKNIRTLAPSPMYICTSCGPANLMKMALVWLAHARARRVFPVPGGPCNKTPGETGWRNKRGSIHSAKEMGCTHASVLMVINKHAMCNGSEFRRTSKLCS